MADILRRINNLEKQLRPDKEIGHCPDCGIHKCWQEDNRKDCDICGPIGFCVDFSAYGEKDCGHDHEFKCGVCGYESVIFLIDLGGELEVEGLEDEY